jgi:glycosyltransferase involved in cell wall biosynthesis
VSPTVLDSRPAVVHVITQLELGGAQRNTLFTVGHLDRRLFRPSLVTGPGGILDDEARALDVPVTFVPELGRDIAPARDTAALRALRDVLELHARGTQGPLVVHTHSSKAGILGRLAARAVGAAAAVHTVHGFGFHDGQHPAVRAAFIAAEHLVAPLTDAMVFVSRRDLDTARRLQLVRRCRVEVIRSGIDLAAFAPDANARAQARAELGVAAGTPVVVTTGNFKAQKNPLVGLAAFEHVVARHPHAVWLFVGDGELRAQFEYEAREKGLWNNIRAVGWRKDVVRLLNAGDVYMLSSDHEGLPRSVLEALRVGLPVAATNAGGTAEVVTPGTGLVVDVGDAHGLARAVLDLLEHPPGDVRAAAAATLEAFDIHAMVRAQERLYLGLLGRPAA